MDYLIFWATAIGQGLSLLAGGYFAHQSRFQEACFFFLLYIIQNRWHQTAAVKLQIKDEARKELG